MKSPTRSVPFSTMTVATGPRPTSRLASSTEPTGLPAGLATSSPSRAMSPWRSTCSRTSPIRSPRRALIGTMGTSPPQSSGLRPISASCCLTRSALASSRSIRLMATTIGTSAAWAWAMASRVWGITPSSAATTRITMSVTWAPRAHLGEGGVARRVDEGDGPAVEHDLVGPDVLGDAAGLAGHHVGLADLVEEGGLAVVDVAHDGHDRWPGLQRILGVVLVVEVLEGELGLLRGARLDQHHLGPQLAGEDLDGLVGERDGGGDHLAVLEQEAQHVGRRPVQLGGDVLGGGAPLDDDLTLGDRRADSAVAGELLLLEVLLAEATLAAPAALGPAAATGAATTAGTAAEAAATTGAATTAGTAAVAAAATTAATTGTAAGTAARRRRHQGRRCAHRRHRRTRVGLRHRRRRPCACRRRSWDGPRARRHQVRPDDRRTAPPGRRDPAGAGWAARWRATSADARAGPGAAGSACRWATWAGSGGGAGRPPGPAGPPGLGVPCGGRGGAPVSPARAAGTSAGRGGEPTAGPWGGAGRGAEAGRWAAVAASGEEPGC